jgi:hypothetical protein
MQQFTVPQFIDVEPKIIGPINVRQFLIFLGAALIIFIFYKIFDFSTFVILSVMVFAISGVFAFLKINGRPFHYFLLNLVQAFKKPGLRIWNHKVASFESKEEKQIEYEKIITPDKYFSKEKLAKLSLIIDTKGKYKGEDSENMSTNDN